MLNLKLVAARRFQFVLHDLGADQIVFDKQDTDRLHGHLATMMPRFLIHQNSKETADRAAVLHTTVVVRTH